MGRTHHRRGAPNLFLGLEEGGGEQRRHKESRLGLSVLTRDARAKRVLVYTRVNSAKQTAWTGFHGGVSFHDRVGFPDHLSLECLQSCDQVLFGRHPEQVQRVSVAIEKFWPHKFDVFTYTMMFQEAKGKDPTLKTERPLVGARRFSNISLLALTQNKLFACPTHHYAQLMR